MKLKNISKTYKKLRNLQEVKEKTKTDNSKMVPVHKNCNK